MYTLCHYATMGQMHGPGGVLVKRDATDSRFSRENLLAVETPETLGTLETPDR